MRIDVRSLMLALAAVSLGAADAAEFRQDFRDAGPDPASLRIVGADRGCKVESTPAGLLITIPKGADQGGQVGVEFVRSASGDFEIEVDYDARRIGPPKDGHGAGFGLWVEADDSAKPAITVERQNDWQEGDRFVSTHIFDNDAGERQYRAEVFPAKANAGRLKITREGSTVQTWAAEGEGEYLPLRSVEFGAGEIRLIRAACFTGGADCAIEVAIPGIAIKADSLSSPAPVPPPPAAVAASTPLWKRPAILGAVGLVVLAALVAWGRPRDAARARRGG